MQNIPEGLFYWQWASNILNIGMSAAAALPVIMALTLLAGRRGNARLCILGTQRLTRLALGLGLLGPLLTAADLAATLISLGGSSSLLNSLSLWDDAVLPYTTTVLAWIGGLCCLWIVAYLDGRSPLAAGLPDEDMPAAKNSAGTASKGRSTCKARRAPAPVEGSGKSDQLAGEAMRGRLCLYLMAAICFFCAQVLPNWSFSGPPQGMEWGRMVSAVLGAATHNYFTCFAPAGAFALLTLSFFHRKGAPFPAVVDLEKAVRWCALWALIGYIPRCIDRWGLFIGFSFSGQSLPDWLTPQVAGLVPLTLAVICWAILFTARSRLRMLWLNWLALALLVVRQSLPFIMYLLRSAS
ncbi:MAG: hypothetical protein BCS36_13950 [Desulfovibrio sp. MES5]|uniref:hypothetical protein n=1 Tax=Desulfovibrio sp. MES5 TaxID=1899016 RepID=UPI000B9CE0E8|nr:hypothetical protein [Desulfovibrio sp. MES5]OXS29145.1 MAG: hypothetical protein BCS36_13950 [Desulfovibrio sp. MES5]